MGCGASTASDDVAVRYVDQPQPAFAQQALHAGCDFDASVSSEVVQLIRRCEHELSQQSMCSDGTEASEPGAVVLAAKRMQKTVAARLFNGITDDPEQFVPEEVPPIVIAASHRLVRQWQKELELALSTPPEPPTRVTSRLSGRQPEGATTMLPGACPSNPAYSTVDPDSICVLSDSAHAGFSDSASATNHFIASPGGAGGGHHARSSVSAGETFAYDDDDDSPTLCADLLALHDKVQMRVSVRAPMHLRR